MPTRVEIHPTAKIALYAVCIGLVVALSLIGAKHFIRFRETIVVAPQPTTANNAFLAPTGDLLFPVIELTVADASLESHWAAAFASGLTGRIEVPVESGRVRILTEHYSIAVARLEKWHEAIGQAAHYAIETGKIPVVAIILPSDLWPVSPVTKAKLLLIDETCIHQNIKLVILHRAFG